MLVFNERSPLMNNMNNIELIIISFTVVCFSSLYYLANTDTLGIDVNAAFAIFNTFLLWFIFNSWAWRIFAKLGLINKPDLNGEWHGRLDFLTIDGKKTLERQVDVEIFIKQSFMNLTVTYKGIDQTKYNNKYKTIQSSSTVAQLKHIKGSTYRLHYIFNKYTNSDAQDLLGVTEFDINSKSKPLSMKGRWLSGFHKPKAGCINVQQYE